MTQCIYEHAGALESNVVLDRHACRKPTLFVDDRRESWRLDPGFGEVGLISHPERKICGFRNRRPYVRQLTKR